MSTIAMQTLYDNLISNIRNIDIYKMCIRNPDNYPIYSAHNKRLWELKTQFGFIQSNDEAKYHAIRREYYADLVASRQRDQKRGRTFGRLIATAIQDSTDENIEAIIDYAGFLSSSNIEKLAISIKHLNLGITKCASPDCSTIVYSNSNSDYRYSDTHEGYICPACAEKHVVTKDTVEFRDPDEDSLYIAYTQYRFGRFDNPRYFYDNGDLLALNQPDYNGAHTVTHVTRDAYEDSDWSWPDWADGIVPFDDAYDSPDSKGRYPYAEHPYRENGYYFDEPDDASLSNIPIGMEYEVYVKGQPDSALAEVGLDWILETDGSLDSEHGTEIVSPPLCRSEWEKTLPLLTAALVDERATAYDAPEGNDYGIHLTISRRYLTPLQEVRMSLFLLAEENADFVRAIAQRWDIYNPSRYNIGSQAKPAQKVGSIGYVRGKVFHGPDCKYMPLNLKGSPKKGLAEFRIFQSTLVAGRVLKDMEFVWSLVRWTSREETTGTSWQYTDYCRWLYEHREQYPTLVAYLTADSYRVKHAPRRIQNTWKELLDPVDPSAPMQLELFAA